MRKMSKFAAGCMCLATAGLVLAGCRKAQPASTTPDTTPEVSSEAVTTPEEPKADAPVSLGGYEWVSNNTPAMMDDADSARIAVTLRGDGTDFDVLDLVATQVVSGTNYKALCRGNDDNLYVVTWYCDLQDNASLTSAECVNIGAYSGL